METPTWAPHTNDLGTLEPSRSPLVDTNRMMILNIARKRDLCILTMHSTNSEYRCLKTI